jgi:hypothetical protein
MLIPWVEEKEEIEVMLVVVETSWWASKVPEMPVGWNEKPDFGDLLVVI